MGDDTLSLRFLSHHALSMFGWGLQLGVWFQRSG
jgi:hypothetical protein